VLEVTSSRTCFLLCFVPDYSFFCLIVLETEIQEPQDVTEMELFGLPEQRIEAKSELSPQQAAETNTKLQEQQMRDKSHLHQMQQF